MTKNIFDRNTVNESILNDLGYISAENYIQLNLPKMLSELTKNDKESYAISINVFKIPFGAENVDSSMVYISAMNVKLEHKQDFLDMVEEKFGLDPAWLTKDEDYIYENDETVANYNLAYQVPIDLIEKLAILYKIAN